MRASLEPGKRSSKRGYWVIGAVLLLGTCVGVARNTGSPAATNSAAATAAPAKPTAAPKAATEPTAAPTAIPTATAALSRFMVVNAGADGVSLRSEPSTSAQRLKVVKDGAMLLDRMEERQAEGRAWQKVSEDGSADAWIAAEFLRPAAPLKEAAADDPRWMEFTSYGLLLGGYLKRSDTLAKEHVALAQSVAARPQNASQLFTLTKQHAEVNGTLARQALTARTPNEAREFKDAVYQALNGRKETLEKAASWLGDASSVPKKAAYEESKKKDDLNTLRAVAAMFKLCETLGAGPEQCQRASGLET